VVLQSANDSNSIPQEDVDTICAHFSNDLQKEKTSAIIASVALASEGSLRGQENSKHRRSFVQTSQYGKMLHSDE